MESPLTAFQRNLISPHPQYLERFASTPKKKKQPVTTVLIHPCVKTSIYAVVKPVFGSVKNANTKAVKTFVTTISPYPAL
jgi:hypothetical protein